MSEERYKIGDKIIIPTTKSTWGSVESSTAINKAREIGQNFLYFAGYYDNGTTVALSYLRNGGGDYFKLSDVVGRYKENKSNW